MMTRASPRIVFGSISVEIGYSDGSTRTITLPVEERVLIGGTEHDRWYPGVMARDDDFDAECVAYGINEGRVTHCDYRPRWSYPATAGLVEMETWRIVGVEDVALLREYGIIEEER